MPSESPGSCPTCGHSSCEVFFEAERLPVFCNVLLPSREAARGAATASVRLGYCPRCSLIRNVDFDPRLVEYDEGYENSLHFSPRFQTYAEELAAELIGRHALRGKDIVEIGCGQGDFLELLCRQGPNRGRGFDPSFRDAGPGSASTSGDVRIVAQPYSVTHRDVPADFVCCRHVLEHIADPVSFLRGVRAAVGSRADTVVFFEVPNALYTIRDLGIWDIIYEHCSYFLAPALARAFREAGFSADRVDERFEGQFLAATARPAEGAPVASSLEEVPADVPPRVRGFGAEFRAKVASWRERLDGLEGGAVLWGAGSKGVTFLNVLDVSTDRVDRIVDVNPHKEGRFVPGTGQQVVRPDALRERPPRTVVIMNPIYREEIEATLRSLGLSAQVLVA